MFPRFQIRLTVSITIDSAYLVRGLEHKSDIFVVLIVFE